MALKDLSEFLEDPYVLPILGKDYAFPGSIGARTGLVIQRVVRMTARAHEDGSGPETELLSDAEDEAVRDEMLGEHKEELLDRLTSTQFRKVTRTLLAFHGYGPAIAELIWNKQGEATAPNRAARRSKPPAKSTRSRGSRATSTPRKKPAAPPGPTSSTDGT